MVEHAADVGVASSLRVERHTDLSNSDPRGMDGNALQYTASNAGVGALDVENEKLSSIAGKGQPRLACSSA